MPACDEGLRARAYSTGAGAAVAYEWAPRNEQQGHQHPPDWQLEQLEQQQQQQQQGRPHGSQSAISVQALRSVARRTSREARDFQQRQQQQQQQQAFDREQLQLRTLSNESALGRAGSQVPAPQAARGLPGASGGARLNSSCNQIIASRTADGHKQSQPAAGGGGGGGGGNSSLQAQAVGLLRKSAFTCTVLGARQTGKRTIVICFVKLLNEFKLAADECKKEQMLAKLLECSERLHELTSRAQDNAEQQEAEREEARRRQRRSSSRLNSWLPSSGAVRQLLNLSPVSARKRLHSVVSPPPAAHQGSRAGEQRQQQCYRSSVNLTSASGTTSQQTGGDAPLGQRRHTTFEPANAGAHAQREHDFRLAEQQQQQQQHSRAGPIQTSSSSGRLLSVHSAGGPSPLASRSSGNLAASSAANKSDTNINYQASTSSVRLAAAAAETQTREAKAKPGRSAHQLQVPSLDMAMIRKHSDPTASRSTSSAQQQQQQQQCQREQQERQRHLSAQSPGSVFLSEHACGQRRHTTMVPFGPLLGSEQQQRQQHHHHHHNHNHQLQQDRLQPGRDGGPSRKRAASAMLDGGQQEMRAQANGSGGGAARRRQSICLSRRRRRILLSLKELNRRKFAIRFNTRRQISESLVAQIHLEAAERQRQDQRAARTGRRRSTILQLTGGGCGGLGGGAGVTGRRTAADSPLLPDSFLVVYSISDRDSFEYARSLVEQLRSLASQQAHEIPLPIVLVANKSDLERNREVKSEDGRAVARKFACKFIEISCTIGFNLDNLLVGLRTQLVLKHHIVLNSILRPGFRYKARHPRAAPDSSNNRTRQHDDNGAMDNKRAVALARRTANEDKQRPKRVASDNILIRLCKRYVMDSNGNDYDCDNFSKL